MLNNTHSDPLQKHSEVCHSLRSIMKELVFIHMQGRDKYIWAKFNAASRHTKEYCSLKNSLFLEERGYGTK